MSEELTPATRADLGALSRLSRRIEATESKLERLRRDRLALYRQLVDEGVSHQVIADAAGLIKSAVTVALRRAARREPAS